MRNISKNRQEQIKSAIEDNSELITEVLEKLAANKWTELTQTQNTVKRLKRKGHRKTADLYAQYDERINKNRYRKDSEEDEVISTTENLDDLNKIIKEGIVGSNDIIPSNFLHKGSQLARSVGRISTKDTREPLGTGFLVSPNLMMTNNHVIRNISDALSCIIEFDFFADESGSQIVANEFRLMPDKLFLKSDGENLDYSIIAVEPTNDFGAKLSQFGYIPLIEETGKAHKGERLNIIHHPQGKPQQISIRKNILLTHDDESLVRLFYMTDTEPGSSGSPVLNDNWELVALHYASIEINDEHQKNLFFQNMYKEHKDMVLEMGDGIVRINSGIRISIIVNNINTLKVDLSPDKRALIDEMFDITPSIKPNPSGKHIEYYHKPEDHAKDSYTESPININVNIGNRGYQYPDVANNIISNGSSVSNLKAKLELYDSKLSSQKSVFKALTFLEEARNSKYLPIQSEIDNRIKNYYDTIISDVNNNISEEGLYNRLNDLMESTFKLADKFPDTSRDLENLFEESLESINLEGGGVSYAKARAHLYTWVDLHEDRMLRGVYTQALIAPEQLLLKDLIKSLKLDIELPRRYKNNQFLNCEHIVPKSLFNEDREGFSDLHHLITAEGATNTYRNNCPFRDLGQEGEEGPASLASYIDFGGKRHNGFFEPFNNKPLVARATLYFIVSHKNKLSKSTYDKESIDTLIDWSNQAKPNKYELHRNESIFEIQGNRNPFIDFPNWVDKVDFLIGLKD